MIKLGDFSFDRLISATAEAKGEIQYVLNQLQMATIDITAEAKEILNIVVILSLITIFNGIMPRSRG